MLCVESLVEKEFEKNPQIKREDIDVFRKWLNGQPHLPSDKITGKIIKYFF